MKKDVVVVTLLVLFSLGVDAEEFIDPFPEEGLEEKWVEEEWLEEEWVEVVEEVVEVASDQVELEEEVVEVASDQVELEEDEEMVAVPVEIPPLSLPEVISPPLPSFVIDETVAVEDISEPSVVPIEGSSEEVPVVESAVEGEGVLPPEIVPLDLSELDCEPAIYSNEIRQASLPSVEVPLYTDIDGLPLEIEGQPVMLTGLYSAVLEMPFGFSDFEVKEFSFQEVVTESDPCHAKFVPASGILEVPEIEVPTLVLSSYDQLSEGPVMRCRAVLQQSVLRVGVFGLEDFECYWP